MKRNHQFLLLSLVTILVVAFSSFSKGGKKPKRFAGYKKSEYNTYYLMHKKGVSTIPVDTLGAVFVKMKFKTPDD